MTPTSPLAGLLTGLGCALVVTLAVFAVLHGQAWLAGRRRAAAPATAGRPTRPAGSAPTAQAAAGTASDAAPSPCRPAAPARSTAADAA